MTSTSLSLDDDIVAWLDEESKRIGTSRTRLANRILFHAMRESSTDWRATVEARLKALFEHSQTQPVKPSL